MIIEQGDDEMQTKDRLGLPPTAIAIFTGEGMTIMSDEIEFRMRRLAAEADHARLATQRDGVRQRLGHGLMALGRVVHGIEAEHATRRALDAG